MKEEILHGKTSRDENIGGGRSNLPSDPTGTVATLLASHVSLQHMERVVEVIDKVYQDLDKHKKELIRLKYWTKPQTLTWDGIALKLNISRITALRWRDDIIVGIAVMVGWK
jgi:RinA family phage transcriptional activator